MFSLLISTNPADQLKLISYLASSRSPYTLLLLEEIVKMALDADVIAYAHQAIPNVKEEIFQAFKDARALEKAKAKKEFSKLESSAVQEHVESLLLLSRHYYQREVYITAQKYFARAYALDPQILRKGDNYFLGELVFGAEELMSALEAHIKLQNKHERGLSNKYPWYVYLADFSLFFTWLGVFIIGIGAYFEVLEQYPLICHRRGIPSQYNCGDWGLALSENFARLAPHIPRILIAGFFAGLFLLTGIRIWVYLLELRKRENVDWREEARGNVFEDIERELLKVFSPRQKKGVK